MLAESGGLADTKAGGGAASPISTCSRRRAPSGARKNSGDSAPAGRRHGGLQGGPKKQLTRAADSTERLELLGGVPDARRQPREETWEEALRALAKRQRANLAALPAQKSAPEKVRLAAAMKASTSVSNGWLAGRLAMGEPASVSQYVPVVQVGGGGE